LPENGRGVVVAVVDCLFAYIHCLGNDVMLSHSTTEFQITVGDGTFGVFEGGQRLRDLLGETRAPQIREVAVGGRHVEDTPHAHASSVSGAFDERGARHEFSDACRSGSQFLGEPSEVIEEIVDMLVEA
jgi:hypothetical protein